MALGMCARIVVRDEGNSASELTINPAAARLFLLRFSSRPRSGGERRPSSAREALGITRSGITTPVF
jgi:hypothetical protein